MEHSRLATFVKYNRQRLGMTQADLALKSGVGLRFIRELEQGKPSLRLDKVNQTLQLFGHTIAPQTAKQLDPYDILLNYTEKQVRVRLRNTAKINGLLTGATFQNGEVMSWHILHQQESVTILHADIEEINLA